MSSTQYLANVVEMLDRSIDLKFRLVGDLSQVYAEVGFIARVLSESLTEERMAELFPEAPDDSLEEFVWTWMTENADALIEESSITLHDTHDYPSDMPSESKLLREFRDEYSARWNTERTAIIRDVGARVRALGGRLEFEDELDVYDAATLDDLVDELVCASFDAFQRREPHAPLLFRVHDPKWIAHLAVGDSFESLAWPP